MKLSEVAQKLGCRLEGPPELEIRGVAGIEHAEAGQITFLANRRYFPLLKTTRASAVLVEEGITLERKASLPALAALRSGNPYLAFAQAIELFYQPPRYAPGIHPTAIIAKSARIGEDFLSHAHAVVREFCRLGNRVILQNGVVIGGDGFGFAKQRDGTWHKMLQAGPAVLEDDVEVQANSCVDRATIGETRIAGGAKIDDLVLVGHGSRVGANTLLCGQVGLAGSTKVGGDCILAGQVGSGGHITIGDRTMITAQSGVPHDLAGNTHYSGSPCVDHRQWLKNAAALNRMPDLQKRVRELEAEVEKLKPR